MVHKPKIKTAVEIWLGMIKKSRNPKCHQFMVKANDIKPRYNTDLIAVSTSSRNIILINQFGIFLLSTSKLSQWPLFILYRKKRQSTWSKPFLFPKRKDGQAPKRSFFLFVNSSLALPFFLLKPDILYNLSECPSSCWMGCCQIHELLNKAK